MTTHRTVIGIDVGARRKGFDAALLDDREVAALIRGLDREAVVELVSMHEPALVAVDGPRSCAPEGQSTRECERGLNTSICGIRWTPDRKRVHAEPYFAWIVEGLALYAALAAADVPVIEVFPTASWTRWHGPRGPLTRAAWTRHGLARLCLTGLPERTNQDQRDAIAAAMTAQQHTRGLTQQIGEIVVPAGRWETPATRSGSSFATAPLA
jgi:predicted nuclease with RNAse H fold